MPGRRILEEANPFQVFEDEVLFAMQEKERMAKRRAQESRKAVHERTTKSAELRHGASRQAEGELNIRRYKSRSAERYACMCHWVHAWTFLNTWCCVQAQACTEPDL